MVRRIPKGKPLSQEDPLDATIAGVRLFDWATQRPDYGQTVAVSRAPAELDLIAQLEPRTIAASPMPVWILVGWEEACDAVVQAPPCAWCDAKSWGDDEAAELVRRLFRGESTPEGGRAASIHLSKRLTLIDSLIEQLLPLQQIQEADDPVGIIVDALTSLTSTVIGGEWGVEVVNLQG